jgi:hypothetical protein
MTRRLYLLLLVYSFFTASAWAVPKEDEYLRLARLSYIEGNVSYQYSADIDWSAASVNLPLEPGDRIYTGDDGRAEIEFDDGSVYRPARNTDIEILSLKEERIQIRVLVGLSTLVVASDTDFEINTPVAAFTALRKGTYRFDVDEDGTCDAIVRKGELEAANDHFSRRIQAGEMVRIAMNDADKPEYASYDKRDEWDEWNDRRNADMNAYAGRRYLPDNVYIGASDLHRHGRWINVDSYGLAWVPYSAGVSWAPYSVGRWCYRPFYGWTWVSYEPWGWLPYHYGRWYRSSLYGWCWLPGPSFAFNFWSPALVTFYSGPSWISWCPLGPGDYYNVNRYHYNRGIYSHQLAQLRGLHTRAQGNPFYRGDRDAFRTVNIDQFRNGSFGQRGRETGRRDIDQPWRQGEIVRDRLPVQPTTASFRPDPDRRAHGPERIARPLPTVVRNSPGENLRGQEQFRRITNPAIPALPSRVERKLTEPQRGPEQGIHSIPNARISETPRPERENSGTGNSQANSPTQSGRKVTTYRWAGTTENNREDAKSREGFTTTAPSENNTPPNEPRGSSAVRSARPTQEQRKAQPPSSGMSPRVEPYYRPNNYVEQGSGAAERPNNNSSGFAQTPRTESNPTYRSPQQESAPSYRAPSVESAPSLPAPRIERARDPVPLRQSAPSMNRDSGPGNHPTPSQNRSGGNPGASSAGKSGENRPAGASAGTEAQGHNRK